PGLEIAERGIQEQRIARSRRLVGEAAQVSYLAVDFADRSGHLVADTQVKHQVRTIPEVILQVSREDRRAQTSDGVRTRNRAGELRWLGGQHVLNVGKRPGSVRGGLGIDVVEQPLDAESGSKTVAAMSPGQIVVGLR